VILNQKNQTVHTFPCPEFQDFSHFVSLPLALFRFCRAKSQGFDIFDIFQTLFFLVFQERNLWRLSVKSDSPLTFGRDTVYRFFNSPWHNWRRFLFFIASKTVIFFRTLTSDSKRKIFVADDSSYNKNRSHKLELLSKLYDHAEKCYYRGYRFLTLAFTDGISLVPIDFSLLGSQKVLCPADKNIDKRSRGQKRRIEATSQAPDVLLSMIDSSRSIISKWSYILADSWFSNPSFIRELTERQLHFTGRLKDNATRFLFRRNGKDTLLTLAQLFGKLDRIPKAVRRKQRQTADILGSLRVALPSVVKDGQTLPPIPVKIVFLKNRNISAEKQWIAIITSDVGLNEEEIVQMYAKRWKIEEFFKVAKSLLKLEREFQGRSFDMLIAHTTLVCVRYIFLELERRKSTDIRTCGELFYYCCDEIPDLKIKEAIQQIFLLLGKFLASLLPDSEECLKNFIASFPAPLLRLFSFSCCES
jgi:hypothetical protein